MRCRQRPGWEPSPPWVAVLPYLAPPQCVSTGPSRDGHSQTERTGEMRKMRKLLAGLAAVAVVTAVALVTPAAAHAGTWCGIRWGSLDRATSTGGGSPLINV